MTPRPRHGRRFLVGATIVAWLLYPCLAFAQTPATDPPGDDPAGQEVPPPTDPTVEADRSIIEVAPIYVVGTQDKLSSTGGAVYVLSETELQALEYDDPHSVLLQVPGVYVRQEDGVGLRPNIGLRGASSERSKKITLMEDGVLVAPAPYAAPAAYYFPLMSRMVGLEVTKGPSSIVFGPQTIGGALNLLSRDIPIEAGGVLEAALGMFLNARGHGYYGMSGDTWGFLAEGIHLQSDGFKTLDTGGDTGFSRSEFVVRGRVNSNLDTATYQQLDLRLTYSRERSSETYLGLTDTDFARDPYRRYAASELGLMDWWRVGLRLDHRLELGDRFELLTTAYRHDFERVWTKLAGFADGPTLEQILSDPTGGVRGVYYDVLTGAQDSSDAEVLMVGTNDRGYIVHGLQSLGRLRGDTEVAEWEVELGVRLHHDRVRRLQTESPFLMVQQALVPQGGGDTETTTDSEASALAFASHLSADVVFPNPSETAGNITLSGGIRSEIIETSLTEDGETLEGSQIGLIPGVGVHFAITDALGVLAGVHRGFSPVSPGQPDAVEPETSINYEAGLRFLDPASGSHAELIGFYNDYSNLTGECTFSAGCDNETVDQQFNGGEAQVMGLEASASHTQPMGNAWELTLRSAYTFTQTEFLTGFESENPQWGQVEIGDELPYVPAHQASVSVGLTMPVFGIQVSTTYAGAMRETAGQGEPEDHEMTDAFVMLDVLSEWEFLQDAEVYARADNLLGVTPIVSRRPFGARPAKPFQAQLGIRYAF